MNSKIKILDNLIESTPFFNHPRYWHLYRRLKRYIDNPIERSYIPFYIHNFTDINIPVNNNLIEKKNILNANLYKLWELTKNNTLQKTLLDSRFKILKNNIVDSQKITKLSYSNGFMMQCDWCGNIWDGCAQCNCSLNNFDLCY